MRPVLALACLTLLASTPPSAAESHLGRASSGTPTAAPDPRPLIAYYYIWFSTKSWGRAKRDYPALGRYSSDDREVLRAHVRAAKAAGISAFAVSWKSTALLDHRLELLMAVAREEDFKLAIVYQGLDVHRRPLPVERVAEDFDVFAERYAADPLFLIYDKPLMIWSGTWEFGARAVASVTRTRRERLLVLATERSAGGYERLTGSVDGNAYYWSSVNPETYPDHAGKLQSMAQAVRRDAGLWIAPVAPGFDARAIGGTTVVERRGDVTLRQQWEAALSSEPDALGLISWNEFTENTHVEPSVAYADTALRAVAELRGAAPPPRLSAVDSSEPTGVSSIDSRAGGLLLVLAAVTGHCLLVRRRRAQEAERPTPSGTALPD